MMNCRLLVLMSVVTIPVAAMEADAWRVQNKPSYFSPDENNEESNNDNLFRLNKKQASDNQAPVDGDQLYKLGYAYYFAQTSSPELREDNLKKARSYLEQAVKQGHGRAANLLGEMWQKGKGGKIDFVKAENLYLLAQKKGVYDANYNLAELYRHTNQTQKAYKLHSALEAYGDKRSRIALGNIHLHGGKGVAPDLQKAITLYEKMAQQGDLTATYYLARAYYKNKLYEEAMPYFQEINESPTAQQVLGTLVFSQVKAALANIYGFRGLGSPQEAVELFEEALALGNKDIQPKLKLLKERLARTKKSADKGGRYSALGAS
ncbi:SEL1-like repeat protein [Candidatus Odyssella thessalonicensis]|uniref:SEL1-like repeat protein n=1 Tax=Candidatus Odyssella thessalonicensis TaxID=84647 RepID=UPI000316CF4D|nr:tetratricopeptide repeat protein [Candidatus Odyssella thessalonicensis]